MNLKEYGIDIKKGKIELHKSSFTGREWRVLQRIFGTTPDCVAIKVEGNLKISKIDKVGFQNNYKQILEQDPAEKTFDLNVIKSFIMSKGGSINIDELYYTPMYRPTVNSIRELNKIILAVEKNNKPFESEIKLMKESDILNIGYFIFSCVIREIHWTFKVYTDPNSDKCISFPVDPYKTQYKLCVNKGILGIKVDNK